MVCDIFVMFLHLIPGDVVLLFGEVFVYAMRLPVCIVCVYDRILYVCFVICCVLRCLVV